MKTLDVRHSKIKHYVMVAGADRTNDATRRLTSVPLGVGMRQFGQNWIEWTVDEHATLTIQSSTCLLFHYDDRQAEMVMRRSQQVMPVGTLIVCLASDVYSYDDYLALQDLVDFYVAPTSWHRLILSCQLSKPVYLVPEGIDPITSDISLTPLRSKSMVDFPAKTRMRLVWFGYAESFSKGMSSLMPVIEEAVALAHVEGFTVIVNQERFERLFGSNFNVSTLPYADNHFREQAADFDYAILSHFPLDLHINSLIKSPNKAITALFAGLIPLCSRTPNYSDLLESFGLQRFLFSSPSELRRLLNVLDPIIDIEAIRASGILTMLWEQRSPESMATNFMSALQRFESSDRYDSCMTLRPGVLVREHQHTPGVREHLKQLLTSVNRSLKRRLAR